MTAIVVLPRQSDNLIRRWSRTGRDHARPNNQSKPATATLNDRLNHQAELLPPPRAVIDRLEAPCARPRTPSRSIKSP
jgi:hypothetical protein